MVAPTRGQKLEILLNEQANDCWPNSMNLRNAAIPHRLVRQSPLTYCHPINPQRVELMAEGDPKRSLPDRLRFHKAANNWGYGQKDAEYSHDLAAPYSRARN
jgi:hypothetical protein